MKLCVQYIVLISSLCSEYVSSFIPNRSISVKTQYLTYEESSVGMKTQKEDDFIDSSEKRLLSRMDFVKNASLGAIASNSVLTFPVFADEDADSEKTFVRIKKDGKIPFAYKVVLPASPSPTNKPLQTHLDEVNLPITSKIPEGRDSPLKSYTYGVTVDPIRIQSLRQFGTPNEVAAKIVMAELRRDGVLDVTMGRDPTEDSATGGYDVEYISDGTRGKKHFVTRTIVDDGKLYVLTAQCKEEDWKYVSDEVWASIATFQVLKE